MMQEQLNNTACSYSNSTFTVPPEFNNYYYYTENNNGTTKMPNYFKDKYHFGIYKNAAISPYGVAFKDNNDGWIATIDGELIDVTGLVVEIDCVYAMPVAINDIKEGDYILHNGKPAIVRLTKNDSLWCDDIWKHEKINVIPVKSPYGFDFYTKLINFMGKTFSASPNKEKPFGNILPFLMMSNKDSNNFIPLWMMLTAGESFKNPFKNFQE